MRLYLVRHGETDKNKGKYLQGQSDSPLNDYGIELAYKTKEGLKDVAFDYAFSSPLQRALKTAEIILEDKGIEPIVDKRIQEISFGIYEGLCYHKDNFTIPDKDFVDFFEDPLRYVVPENGESFNDIIGRTKDFIDELVGNPIYQDTTILVATHGCALKALFSNITKEPFEQYWVKGVHKNCAVSIIDIKDKEVNVIQDGGIYY